MLLVIMIVLALLGMPIAFAIGIASMVCLISGGYSLLIMPQQIMGGLNSFVLLGIPFFILAGNVMDRGGITTRIFAFCKAVFGWLQGSLAIITCVTSAIFASLTGSGVATVSAIGGMTIPSMIDDGYDRHFATAVACNAAILGPLIPPSIFLIVYGNAAGVEIISLFKAALIPGILLAGLFVIYCFIYAKRHNLKKSIDHFEMKPALKATKDGFFALMMPVLLLGAIFGGFATPTEAASVACVYTFIVALLIYRTVNLKTAFNILCESALTTGVTMYLMGTSKLSGWLLAIERVPQQIATAMLSVSDHPWMIILLINIFILIVGCFVEGNAAIVMLTPILYPIATEFGLSGVQFGIIMCVALCMGLITPPVGGCLVIGNEIGKGQLEKTFVNCLPFLGVECIVLFLVNAVPALTSWF